MRVLLAVLCFMFLPTLVFSNSADVFHKIEKDLDSIIVKDLNKKKLIFTKAENQRLKEIDDLEVSGHKNLVVAAKYGETTVNAGILAMNVLKADKEAKAKLMANIQADANEIQPVNKTDEEGQEPKNNDEAKLNEYNALFAKAATSIKR